MIREERLDLIKIYRNLLRNAKIIALPNDVIKVRQYITNAWEQTNLEGETPKLNTLMHSLQTALIATEEMGLGRLSILAILLSPLVINGCLSLSIIEQEFGIELVQIINGLVKINELQKRNVARDNEHFRSLLISFAEDIRVILIIIAERLYLMRIAETIEEESRLVITTETSYLYAPLSHKLGLYKVKSELEDLVLKIHDRTTYNFIKQKLNETKQQRDKYIAAFILPIKEKLMAMGFRFDIKGRTKSIHSIHNKLVKQRIEFERIYDLFAIRIILDTSLDREKAECWQVYSIITDMYQPNPKRTRDWLSVPKSNGYESLHTTVMGQGGRWVEVQIRTQRMDVIAENGLAAHWKYKGLKGESGLDNWLNNVRFLLEQKDISIEGLIDDFKMDLYDDEIFVFTPKGDLFKLPQGATVLDFAFAIHTKIGLTCISAKINGKNVSIRQKLHSGDQIEIQTSLNQKPKQDWLKIAVTVRARVKIKQFLKEQNAKQTEYAKELLHRRFRNRKIEEDEARLMRLIKKMGYKTVTDFYVAIAKEYLDINTVIDYYTEEEKREQETIKHINRSVENYQAPIPDAEKMVISDKEDVLIIDKNLTHIDYTLAKCCNPIYGDEIFGFVSSQGIKIHRLNCPNAPTMFARYGYRIVKSRWTGKSNVDYSVSMRIVGNDDIGIVANITSVIAKENGVNLRSINIDSQDGLFQGVLTVGLNNTSHLESLIKKLKIIKGVKQIVRY